MDPTSYSNDGIALDANGEPVSPPSDWYVFVANGGGAVRFFFPKCWVGKDTTHWNVHHAPWSGGNGVVSKFPNENALALFDTGHAKTNSRVQIPLADGSGGYEELDNPEEHRGL